MLDASIAAFRVTMLILHWLTTSHCLLFRSTQCHRVTKLSTVTLDHYHSINTTKSNPNSSCDLTSNYPTQLTQLAKAYQRHPCLLKECCQFFLSNWWKYLQLMLVANLGGQTCQPNSNSTVALLSGQIYIQANNSNNLIPGVST